jgi:hypothetical protein
MRQNQSQNPKRSRGRGRRNNSHGQSFNRNTTFDSNGPEGRLRGNAQQLFEKYTALAHDANAAGERVSAEAFSQFADHYYRIHQTILQAAEQHKKAHEERRQQDVARHETNTSDQAQSASDSQEGSAEGAGVENSGAENSGAGNTEAEMAQTSDTSEGSAGASAAGDEEVPVVKKRTRTRKAAPKAEASEEADEASEAVA